MFFSFRVYRFLIEILQVILIVGILAVLAIQSYLPCHIKAHVISLMGTFDVVRRDSQIYFAFHGKWPEDNHQALEAGMVKNYSELEGQYKTEIKDGAITFEFNRKVKILFGKKITLRPVIQSDDSFGPVHWISGGKDADPGWVITGIDQTTIENRYVPAFLRY